MADVQKMILADGTVVEVEDMPFDTEAVGKFLILPEGERKKRLPTAEEVQAEGERGEEFYSMLKDIDE